MNGEDEHRYDDIIQLPHHVSTERPPMPMRDRAAQFSPFAALTGYGDAVEETARRTDRKKELTEEEIRELNQKLQLLLEHADERPLIALEYYVPDRTKPGGAYAVIVGRFRRLDELGKHVVLTDGMEIRVRDICRIGGSFFSK